MPSSTSSSEWQRFFRTFLGTTIGAGLFVYLFIVLVDPFGSLPISLPFDRGPVDSNARYAFPLLARSKKFDSAIIGNSTSRLLKPTVLNPLFGARFTNLSMNAATPWEQSRILGVFLDAHPRPLDVLIGLDFSWCMDSAGYQRITDRGFPEWLYSGSRWKGYFEMFDLYTLEKAGQAFAEWTGMKPRVYGRDGYTRFVPDESRYDPAKVAASLSETAPWGPAGPLDPVPTRWDLPNLTLLRSVMEAVPAATRKTLLFVPGNHRLNPTGSDRGVELNAECKRRVAEIGASFPNTIVIDMMRPGPITDHDDNYWDAMHYRVAIADRIAADLADAWQGKNSPDYVVSAR